MSLIKILTLTPLHIGSGNEYQPDFEYLYFEQERKVAVVDAEKVLNILGADNLHQWVACIDNKQPLMPLLRSRKNGMLAEDVAMRPIPAKHTPTRTIREQLHSGNGSALLPGTSLKGAIRTALWAELMLDNTKLAKDKRNLGNEDRRGGFRWSDQPLSKLFFGNDPNHDIFRLLQVGDAEFASTAVYQTDVINKIHNNTWDLKREVRQCVEAIPAGATSTAEIRFNELLSQRAKSQFNRNAAKLQLEQLFPLINRHTKRLVEDEADYWEDTAGNPEPLEDFVEEMNNIVDAIEACQPSECILRTGWGSGFRSMTGDWHGAMTDDDYERLLKSVRPRHSVDLIFPKSMRFVKGGMPMGFVKLTLQSQQ
jgi:CRISPR type III-A-associated RAMP protein Csm5